MTAIADEACEARFRGITSLPGDSVEAMGSTIDSITEEASHLSQACENRVECIQEALKKKFGSNIWKNSCLAKSPEAQSNLYYNIAVTVATLGSMQVYEHMHDLKNLSQDFPIIYFMNSLAWSPVFAEVGCRNQLSKESLADHDSSIAGKVRRFRKSAGNYIFWSAAASTTGLIADQSDKALEQRDKYHLPSLDVLLKTLGTYLVFNVGFGVTKNVLVLDPLFYIHFPYMKSVVKEMIQNKVISEIIFVPTEFSARALAGAGSRKVFLAYRAWIEEQLEHHETLKVK